MKIVNNRYFLRYILLLPALLLLFPGLLSGINDSNDQNNTDKTLKRTKPFIFPLPTGQGITGAFGEIRGWRMHGGIDVTTFGVNGWPIYSMANGYLYDILGSPGSRYGFGQAIQLKHAKGYTSRFGHTDSLTAKYNLEAAWQLFRLMSADSYFTVKYPPGLFQFKQGDTVAHTGERGSGVSHLHFEVKDEQNNYINVYTSEMMDVNDTQPPVAEYIYVYTPGRRMRHGSNEYRRCELKKVKSEPVPEYICEPPMAVENEAAFLVSTYDKTNALSHHSLYALNTYFDGEPVYHIKIDKLTRKELYKMSLLYDKGRSRNWPPLYTYKLFLPSWARKNIPQFIVHHKNYGFIDTKKMNKVTNAMIHLYDTAGNLSIVKFKLIQEKGKPHYHGRVNYNLKKGTHTRKFGALTAITPYIKNKAYLYIKNSKARAPSYLKKVSPAIRVSWSGHGKLTLRYRAPYKPGRGLYNTSGRFLDSWYSKKYAAYVAQISGSGTIYLADDIYKPRFVHQRVVGPLMQSHLVVGVTEKGSGINPDSIEMFIDGLELNKDEIKRWGVYYDYDRYSFYIPTGFARNQKSYPEGKMHILWIKVQDKAGLSSDLYQGYIRLPF